MLCYNCGCQLSEHDFCTACGADVSLYKKIMFMSNRFYNDGLEKANVRDLSGAVTSLRQSLKFDKNNVDARNLLGLVYFEMGEVVAALSEWVISKNLRPDKNIADDYIETLQESTNRLDSINQTIKKYNQAYAYCVQDSKDLAVIQLKKVLSMNPKFIRAHQLLALLYMDKEEWERAQRELDKCMEIDRNNTQTLRYLQEVEMMLVPDENARQAAKRRKDEPVRYQSDNEIIIQPMNVKEPKSGVFATLLNIGIGLIIGAAVCYFLIVPAKVTNAQKEAQKGITNIGNQLDVKTVDIQELEAKIASLETEKEDLEKELQSYVGEEGTLQMVDNLLAAAVSYLKDQNSKTTSQNLEAIAANVNIEETTPSFQDLYNTLRGRIGPDLAGDYYTDGYAAYRNGDYQNAIDLLGKAFYYDNTNVEALFNLGNAYRKSDDRENAIATYQEVINLFPDTEQARTSQKNIEEIDQAVG